jgi:hypothetical protein
VRRSCNSAACQSGKQGTLRVQSRPVDIKECRRGDVERYPRQVVDVDLAAAQRHGVAVQRGAPGGEVPSVVEVGAVLGGRRVGGS